MAAILIDDQEYVLVRTCNNTHRYVLLCPGLSGHMVPIPGGTFDMGSLSGASTEQPVHAVTLSAFLLSAYPVTNAQYLHFCAETEYPLPPDPDFSTLPDYVHAYPNYPAVMVSHHDVLAYCGWIGMRLPTEAEWEYATRAGTTSETYGPLGDIAWYEENSGRHPRPVGRKAPNAFGLYDMLGNVWERCSDWYDADYYCMSPSQDPLGPSRGIRRVIRGGSVFNTAFHSRSALRNRVAPASRYVTLGFRCAQDIPCP